MFCFSRCFFDGLWVSPFLRFHVHPLKLNPQNTTEVQLSMGTALLLRLPPSPVSYFVPLLPVQVSSSSPATSHCPQAHPPPLCPPTTWHLFRFIPISWQTACISTRRAQCSDPCESMADKSMLSLFSMPLLRSIFFFCYFAVCRDLNFAQLGRAHFQKQIVIAQGFGAQRRTPMWAPDEALFMSCPRLKPSRQWFYWSWTWIDWCSKSSLKWGALDACYDCQVFYFEPQLISKAERKQIPFDHIYQGRRRPN